jgi:hypothetical protein
MRILLVFVALALVLNACTEKNESGKSMLRHVVLFKYKDSSSAEDVKKVTETFASLYGKIPQVKAFEWGINNSPENLNQGFTHCYMLSFSSEEDLAAYQIDPAHKQFQQVLNPHMEKVFVVDYWTK